MNENLGLQEGRIGNVSLKIIGTKKTPMIEIGFLVKGHDSLVPLKLWMSNTIISSGINEGKTSTEVCIDTLFSLGFSGKSLGELQSGEISDLFDTDKYWTVNIAYQKDKDGDLTNYFEVRYVMFGGIKLTEEQIQDSFANANSMWKKRIMKKSNESNFTADNVPF